MKKPRFSQRVAFNQPNTNYHLTNYEIYRYFFFTFNLIYSE